MVTTPQAIELLGATSSPYTRKMVALLRYRNIPYRWIVGAQGMMPRGYPEPKIVLLPVFYFRDENGETEPVIDSTPIARRLEGDFSARSAMPDDPVLALVSDLIEDYADEWLSKLMFHYRWHTTENTNAIASYLVYSMKPGMLRPQATEMSKFFRNRQISRRHVVGSNPVTSSVIEDCYTRFLGIFDQILEGRGFVLGKRPCVADFAIFGQMQQLTAVDLPSVQLMWQHQPAVRGWIDQTDDLSGLVVDADDGWSDDLSYLEPLLAEMGRTYIPFILANGKALAAGKKEFECEIMGKRWQQLTQTYGKHCLEYLWGAHAALSRPDKERFAAIIDGSGCEPLFTD